jgi:hypothetical protein
LLRRRLFLEKTKLQEGGIFLMVENSYKKEIPENQEIAEGEELLIGGKLL